MPRRRLATLIAMACTLALFCINGWCGPRHRLQIEEVELDVRFDNDLHADAHGEPWTEWLRTALDATRTVTGTFPRDEVVIRLEGTSRARGAIAFGQVRRSHPPQIRFYVNPRARLHELNADWRGFHEFAHLLIPFPGNDDIWFTEGFASYYQYLLQSRAGVITQREAWQELLDGFKRGLRDRSGRGRTLRSLSPDMWRERAHKRVYWTGAAFFLRVDTRLRSETGGRHSLDSTVAAFHDCCIDRRRRWNARRLIETFAELSVPEIWHQEYRNTIDRLAEPRFERALERLGIEQRGFGLRLVEAAPKKALRDAIAGPRTPDTALAAARPEHGDQADSSAP